MGGDYAHETRRKDGGDNHQTGPKSVSRKHLNRESKIRPICRVKENIVHHPSGGHDVLEKPKIYRIEARV